MRFRISDLVFLTIFTNPKDYSENADTGGEIIEKTDVEYRLLSAWTMAQTEGSLLITGGADARFEVELESDASSAFASLGHDATVTRSTLTRADQRVLDQLVAAQIVVPILDAPGILRVAVLGDRSVLDLSFGDNAQTVATDAQHDLGVFVRTTSTYAQLLYAGDYRSVTVPHLLVDVAFHHTVSLGPLVFPGETACLACLEGRIATRWGDDSPPPEPRVATQYGAFVRELVALEVGRIARGDTSLVNATIAWDVESRTVTKSQLLKVPLCPICARIAAQDNGSLLLPWRRDEDARYAV